MPSANSEDESGPEQYFGSSAIEVVHGTTPPTSVPATESSIHSRVARVVSSALIFSVSIVRLRRAVSVSTTQKLEELSRKEVSIKGRVSLAVTGWTTIHFPKRGRWWE
ncbi:hypothetical protein [Natrinema sp. 74]|uniref:hypothetical protein n=1 Tax=Natrinema sp. 74 TaxID=3384159 RepID=UPI0038D37D12